MFSVSLRMRKHTTCPNFTILRKLSPHEFIKRKVLDIFNPFVVLCFSDISTEAEALGEVELGAFVLEFCMFWIITEYIEIWLLLHFLIVFDDIIIPKDELMLFNDCLEKVFNDVFVILVFLVLHFIRVLKI